MYLISDFLLALPTLFPKNTGQSFTLPLSSPLAPFPFHLCPVPSLGPLALPLKSS